MRAQKLIPFLAFLVAASQAHASLTLLDKDQWKFSVGGFIEVDAINDSTRSFTEIIGNAPVSRPNVIAGEVGRAQMSIRNSRLAFQADAPEVDGWKTKGYLEFDLLGYDPTPPTSSTGASNSEASFFNNPTLRVRHAYLSGDSNGWQLMAGQYWMLLGFQPYYFMPTVQVAPIPAMLYGRTTQVRALKAFSMENDIALQTALAVMRPPERDSQFPGLEGGLRLAFGNRSAGFAGGSTAPQKTQPLSVAFTGAVREIAIPQNVIAPTGALEHFPATAMAADILIPVLASSDGKDVSNTLVIGGEFTTGRGYGDQFGGWTGNQANPLASGSSASTAEKNINLDAGIGGFDTAGNFQLIDLRTFNCYFQFHLPAETHTWFSGGYGRLYSDNMGLLTNTSGVTGGGSVPYNREQVYFGNIFHDFTKAVRMGFEFAQVQTQYNDYIYAHDNRYQLSAWFMF